MDTDKRRCVDMLGGCKEAGGYPEKDSKKHSWDIPEHDSRGAMCS